MILTTTPDPFPLWPKIVLFDILVHFSKWTYNFVIVGIMQIGID